MKALVALFLLALALVLGGTLAQPIVQRWEDKNAYERTIETIQAQDYRYQTEATATSRALTNAAAGPLALIVGMVAVLVVLDYYRQRREPVVRVDGIRSPATISNSSCCSPSAFAPAGSPRSKRPGARWCRRT